MTESKHTTFYIVRHGESQGNAMGNPRFNPEGGSTDWELSKRGIEQAKKRGEQLKSVQFDAAFASTMKRARQTAELIVEDRALKVAVIDNIHERSISKYLRTRPEITSEELKRQMKDDLQNLDEEEKMSYKHGPDMESAKEGASRLATALHKIEDIYPKKTILIVNHGNLMRSFLTNIKFAEYDELPDGSIDNTAYAVVQSDTKSFSVNETHGIHKRKGEKRAF